MRMRWRPGKVCLKTSNRRVWWYQQSAMEGYYGSETNLTRMFKNRDELPFSKQRYNYWRNRAMANDLPISTMALKEPYRHGLWRPPRPAIPPIQRMADANRALVNGGVAYQARALETAPCWFTIW